MGLGERRELDRVVEDEGGLDQLRLQHLDAGEHHRLAGLDEVVLVLEGVGGQLDPAAELAREQKVPARMIELARNEMQEAVNRVQPYELTAALVEHGRKLGFLSTNIDLIYGLPGQSVASCEPTNTSPL